VLGLSAKTRRAEEIDGNNIRGIEPRKKLAIPEEPKNPSSKYGYQEAERYSMSPQVKPATDSKWKL
jgi:hypothetical protein